MNILFFSEFDEGPAGAVNSMGAKAVKADGPGLGEPGSLLAMLGKLAADAGGK